MRKYKAHAATDVTGFGILGHLNYLANAQREKVSLKIDTLPIIRGLYKIEKVVRDFKIKEGFAAETSGGLAICIGKDKAKLLMSELRE